MPGTGREMCTHTTKKPEQFIRISKIKGRESTHTLMWSYQDLQLHWSGCFMLCQLEKAVTGGAIGRSVSHTGDADFITGPVRETMRSFLFGEQLGGLCHNTEKIQQKKKKKSTTLHLGLMPLSVIHKDPWHQPAPLVCILYLKPFASAERPQHTHTHTHRLRFSEVNGLEKSQSEHCLSRSPFPSILSLSHMIPGDCNLPL